MEQTLVRPSSVKAKKITPTLGWSKATHNVRRRSYPLSIYPLCTRELDMAVIAHGPYADLPFPSRNKGVRLLDDESLEMYRLWLLGALLGDIADACGVSKNAVYNAKERVPMHFEVVG